LHLNGTAYVEQGAKATDTVDGDISAFITTSSNVNKAKAGNYTVTYSIKNSAGLTASVTRSVSIIAPATRMIPGQTFLFAPKGKQGDSSTFTADIPKDGEVSLTLTLPSNVTATVRVTDPNGYIRFLESFTKTDTRSFKAPAGKHTVLVTINTASGNVTLGLTLTSSAGTETYFPAPENTK